MRKVWCVRWKIAEHSSLAKEFPDGAWCATKDNAKPSEDATRDHTTCGRVVILRIGSARRSPTCPDCIQLLATSRGGG